MAALQESARGGEGALELGCNEPAESAQHLALRQFVLRMARQSRVAHRPDRRMRLQGLRDGQAVGALTFHTNRQGLDASQQHETVKGAGPAAEAGLKELE